MTWFKPIFLILCCFGYLALNASEGPRIIHFDKSIYKGENQNWSIAQHPNGYMYFGNGAGILEYDGIRWNQYRLPRGQTVRTVSIDAQGRIFTGGFGSFGYWEPDVLGALVYHVLSDSLEQEVVQSEEIWKIVHIGKKTVFQSFSQLYVFENETIKHISPPGSIMLMHAEKDQLYVPVIHQGIYILNDQNTFHLLEGTQELNDSRVASIHQMGSDSLLIGTQKNGLFWYVNKTLVPIQSELSSELKLYQLNRVLRLSNNAFAFGTISNGVILTSHILLAGKRMNSTAGLQNNTVLALFEDSAGQLWIGMDKGIDLVQIQLPVLFYQDESGQIGTVYTAEKYKGRLYLGTNQGVYVRQQEGPDGDNGFKLLPGSQGQVWELATFKGKLLCGHNNGTFLIEGDSFTKISEQTGGWHTIYAPGDSTRLIQGTYNGLVTYLWTDDTNWTFEKRIEGYLGPLRKLHMNNKFEIWGVTPFEGIFRFKVSKDYSRILDISNYGSQQGIQVDARMDLFPTPEELYFFSDGTYYTYHVSTNKMIEQDFIELGSGPQIKKGKLHVETHDEFFVMREDHINWHIGSDVYKLRIPLVQHSEKIEKLDSDTYLFCLENGFALASKTDIQNIRSQLEILSPGISKVFIHDYKQIFPGRFGVDEIVLKSNQNHLTFYVDQPLGFDQDLLQYRLVGFNDEWEAISQNGQKEFTNLGSGQYTFEIRSRSAPKGVKSFSFEIAPKWFLTTWAYLLYTVIIIGLVLLFIRLHESRLLIQKRKMQIEKQRELHQQRIQAINEQLENDVINKSRQLANSTMGLIRKNEILLQVKEELTKSKKRGFQSPGDNQKIFRIIDHHITNQQDWELFEENFSQVHETFFKKLKEDFEELTPGDLKLAAYLKMNLSSKEIAPLLNISLRGVENKRYRLRRKMGLGAEANLTEVMMRY